MKKRVLDIYLSSENDSLTTPNPSDLHTDVIVETTDREKYIASFFTYKNMQTLQTINRKKGDFLYGKYFWVKGMLMVEKCNRKNIRMVVDDLIEEGDFDRVFRKIT